MKKYYYLSTEDVDFELIESINNNEPTENLKILFKMILDQKFLKIKNNTTKEKILFYMIENYRSFMPNDNKNNSYFYIINSINKKIQEFNKINKIKNTTV